MKIRMLSIYESNGINWSFAKQIFHDRRRSRGD